ncbi:MAG: sensor histidine kinase [Bradymonadia bacterium]
MSLSADELDELLGGLVHALANATTPLGTNLLSLRRDLADLVDLLDGWERVATDPGGPNPVHVAELRARRAALQLEPLGPTLARVVIDMQTSVRRAQNLLRAARPLARWQTPEPRAFDLGTWFDETLAGHLPEPGVRRIVARRQAAPGRVEYTGDPDHLAEALKHLVRNAETATAAAGQSEVHVTLELGPEAWSVEVQDAGAGLPPGRTALLEGPFAHAGPDRVGIGLTVVRWVVRNHGGHLTIEPVRAGGLRVRMTFECGAVVWSERRS